MTYGVRKLPYGKGGREVRVSPDLNCPTYLLPPLTYGDENNNWSMLEYALGTVTSEDILEDGIITVDTRFTTPLTVIECSDPTFWAVYRGHRMPERDLSPFVNTYAQWPVTNALTLYFENGYLSQVVPGEEVPPLPWMESAKTWDDGMSACIDFWRSHSILYSKHNTIDRTRSHLAPEWWRRAA